MGQKPGHTITRRPAFCAAQDPRLRSGVKMISLSVGTARMMLTALALVQQMSEMRLDGGRGVHVAHHHGPRMLGLELLQALHVDHVGHRAAGLLVGKDDRAVGCQDGRSLGHEVHAAEHGHVRGGRSGLPRQPQGVADEVGHVLHFGPLVVVREDDRALLFGEPADLGLHR